MAAHNTLDGQWNPDPNGSNTVIVVEGDTVSVSYVSPVFGNVRDAVERAFSSQIEFFIHQRRSGTK